MAVDESRTQALQRHHRRSWGVRFRNARKERLPSKAPAPSDGCGEFWKRDLQRPGSRQPGLVLRVGGGAQHFRCFLASVVAATLTFWPATRGRGWSRTITPSCPFRYSLSPRAKFSPGITKPGSPLSPWGAVPCAPHSIIMSPSHTAPSAGTRRRHSLVTPRPRFLHTNMHWLGTTGGEVVAVGGGGRS